jgi:hypothetical protein
VGGVLVAVVAVVVGAVDVRAAVVAIAGAVGVRVAAEAGTKLLCCGFTRIRLGRNEKLRLISFGGETGVDGVLGNVLGDKNAHSFGFALSNIPTSRAKNAREMGHPANRQRLNIRRRSKSAPSPLLFYPFGDGDDPAFGIFEGEFAHAVELFFQRHGHLRGAFLNCG